MGMAAWLDLKGRDVAAFLVAVAIGYFVGTVLPPSPWSIFAPILVAYHLFLAWLVLTGDHEAGMSMSVFSTIVTHAACMGVVFTFVLGRHFIPYFGLARFGIAALAIFESGWLFVKPTIKKKLPAPTPVVTSTADDYQEWLGILAQQKSSPAAHGASLKADYEKWVRARARQRAEVPSSD